MSAARGETMTIPSVATPPPGKPAAPPPGVRLPPGAVVLRPPQPHGVFGPVVDGPTIYYTDGAGNVWAQAKDGSGRPRSLWSGRRGHAMSLVLARDQVYFGVTPANRQQDKPRIVRVPKTGGAAVTVTETPDDVINLVSDGDHLYFSLFDGSPLRKVPLAGGPSTIVRAPGIKQGAIAVDDRYLYVTDYLRNLVVRAPKTRGGAEHVLAARQPRPVGIALDETYVYFPCEKDGSIRRVPKAGGAVKTIATGQINQDDITVGETFVYWASWDRRPTLRRTRKDGSQPQPDDLLTDLKDPEAIALDGQRVYVTNKGDSDIIGIPR